MTKPRSRKPAATPPAAEAALPAPAPASPGITQSTGPERRPRKREIVLALLTRPEGASTAELMAATGWQAHTVRAALSTLRKDGEVITRTGRGETMRYVARDPR
jgi:hypothetical protein